MISFDSIERIGDALLKEKKLPGQFIIGRHYDQGPIPLAKTYIVELFWNYHGQNLLILHEEQPKTCQYSPSVYESVYEKLLVNFILKGNEIWNLINTKLQ